MALKDWGKKDKLIQISIKYRVNTRVGYNVKLFDVDDMSNPRILITTKTKPQALRYAKLLNLLELT